MVKKIVKDRYTGRTILKTKASYKELYDVLKEELQPGDRVFVSTSGRVRREYFFYDAGKYLGYKLCFIKR